MIIHCHHSSNPVSGEMKRIINIDKDVAGFLSSDIIEVEFYSVRQRKFVKNCGSFTLSDKVIDKYYVPNIPRLGIFNDWYQCIVLFFLFLNYSPQYYIEEWFMPRGIKILKNILSVKIRITRIKISIRAKLI